MQIEKPPEQRTAFLKRFLGGLLELVYPRICLSCRKKLPEGPSGERVCPQCWNAVKRCVPPFCRRCGRHLQNVASGRDICSECMRKHLHFDRAFSACSYEGVIKELIHQFKYGGRSYLGPSLGKLMAEHARQYRLPLEVVDCIIPVPLHSAKLREREFNQAEVLGSFVAREFNKEMLDGCLIRRLPTKAQADLGSNERFTNVRGSFTVKAPQAVAGKNILLVDDVLTTGATSSEAALALKNAGAGIVFVLTLAN